MRVFLQISCLILIFLLPFGLFAQPPSGNADTKGKTKKRVEKKIEEDDDWDSNDDELMLDDDDDDFTEKGLDLEEDDDESDLSVLDISEDDDDAISSLSALEVLSTGETVVSHSDSDDDDNIGLDEVPTSINGKSTTFIAAPQPQNPSQSEPTTSPQSVTNIEPVAANVQINTTTTPTNTEYDAEIDELETSSTYMAIPNDKLVNINLKEVRSLNEVNLTNISEAYPWISADGLRLFFTQNDGEKDRLFYMVREDINDKFSNKQEVPIESKEKGGKFSCWLTNNELEIYYIIRGVDARGSLFHATRSSWDEAFANERKVELDGGFDGFLSSPSLSPDGNRLYLYNGGKRRRMISFFKTGDDQFSYENTMMTPFELGPSQVDKEGDHFLIGLGRSFSHDCSLYWVDRDDKDFKEVQYLQFQSAQMRLRMDQPTLSADGRTLVFVNGLADFWTNNDLYIATLPDDIESVISEAKVDKPTLYLSEPDANPVSDEATISYFLPADKETKGEIVIYNEAGKEVKVVSISPSQYHVKVKFADLPSGNYTYQLRYEGKELSKHTIKVRKD